MNWRAIFLILSLVGIFVLMYVMLLPAREIDTLESVSLRENVIVRGVAEDEKGISSGSAISVKGIEIRYGGFESYNGKSVVVEGYVNEFRGRRYVVAQSIRVIS